MLFLLRSAPEVEKRIHSKLFRKFWEEPGYKGAGLHYCTKKWKNNFMEGKEKEKRYSYSIHALLLCNWENWHCPSILIAVYQYQLHPTGWSKKTVNYNFFLTDLKITKKRTRRRRASYLPRSLIIFSFYSEMFGKNDFMEGKEKEKRYSDSIHILLICKWEN